MCFSVGFSWIIACRFDYVNNVSFVVGFVHFTPHWNAFFPFKWVHVCCSKCIMLLTVMIYLLSFFMFINFVICGLYFYVYLTTIQTNNNIMEWQLQLWLYWYCVWHIIRYIFWVASPIDNGIVSLATPIDTTL